MILANPEFHNSEFTQQFGRLRHMKEGFVRKARSPRRPQTLIIESFNPPEEPQPVTDQRLFQSISQEDKVALRQAMERQKHEPPSLVSWHGFYQWLVTPSA